MRSLECGSIYEYTTTTTTTLLVIGLPTRSTRITHQNSPDRSLRFQVTIVTRSILLSSSALFPYRYTRHSPPLSTFPPPIVVKENRAPSHNKLPQSSKSITIQSNQSIDQPSLPLIPHNRFTR